MSLCTHLPEFPRLCSDVELIPVDDTQALVRSTSSTILLSGSFVTSDLPALLTRFDGQTSLEVLSAPLDPGARTELEGFIRILLDRKLLETELMGEADEVACNTDPHESAYWSQQGIEPKKACDRLADKTVVVVGLGSVGATLATALAGSGVGRLVLVDASAVDTTDRFHGYTAEEIGNSRANVVAQRLRESGRNEVLTFTSSVEALSNWDEVVAEASLVVHCSDNMSLCGYARTDEAARSSGTPWVSVRIDRNTGIYGPFIVPAQTACFTCYELRSRANAEHPSDHTALYRHWRHVDHCPKDWPFLKPLAAMIGNHVAVDLLRYLAGSQLSVVRGRVQHLALTSLESRFHEVLKLPRCPTCSRTNERPMSKIWDLKQTRQHEQV